jgi:hypothetical protein
MTFCERRFSAAKEDEVLRKKGRFYENSGAMI